MGPNDVFATVLLPEDMSFFHTSIGVIYTRTRVNFNSEEYFNKLSYLT